jgi:hypothetical protein
MLAAGQLCARSTSTARAACRDSRNRDVGQLVDDHDERVNVDDGAVAAAAEARTAGRDRPRDQP